MIWHTELRAMKTVVAGAVEANCGEANLTHCGHPTFEPLTRAAWGWGGRLMRRPKGPRQVTATRQQGTSTSFCAPARGDRYADLAMVVNASAVSLRIL